MVFPPSRSKDGKELVTSDRIKFYYIVVVFPPYRFKDGKELVASDRIKFSKDTDTYFSFKITCMDLDDCGTYSVSASRCLLQYYFSNIKTLKNA